MASNNVNMHTSSDESRFDEELAQKLLATVRTSGFMRDFDVFRIKRLLEDEQCHGDFAVTALLTLAQRSLPHYDAKQGSASLELQLRAMAQGLSVLRRTVKQLSRKAHSELQTAVRELGTFCDRDLKLHANPNVEFLMHSIKKDTMALQNDSTKTDLAFTIGLSVSAAVLRVYGRDLMGAVTALEKSSLEWNQAWDAFLRVYGDLRSILASRNGDAISTAVFDTILQTSIDAFRRSNLALRLDVSSTAFKGHRRKTLIAFQLLDTYQESYARDPDAQLAAQACSVATSYLTDLSLDESVRTKSIELFIALKNETCAVEALASARLLYEGTKLSKKWKAMFDGAENKLNADTVLQRRLKADLHASSRIGPSQPLTSGNLPLMPNPYDNSHNDNVDLIHRLPDGSWYEGPMENGLFHGDGVWTRLDGQRRAGEFKNGFLNGRGNVSYANGDTREGIFSGGRHQSGILVLARGEIHEGDFDSNGHLVRGVVKLPDGGGPERLFVNGKLVASGPLAYPTGKLRRVEGTFADGLLHGRGRVEYADGDSREGIFGTGHHRSGVFLLSSGERHEGEFDADGRLERGSQISAKGMEQEGHFVNGKLDGFGLIKKSYGDRRREDGVFRDGFLNGPAKVNYANGHCREGIFEGGRHRSGVLTLPDGQRHEGEFGANGKLVQGVIVSPAGHRQEGFFSDAELHGYGRRIKSSGQRRREEGIFKSGQLEGQALVLYANGHRREGLFKGNRHHSGILTLPNGERHEGEFDSDGNLKSGGVISSEGLWREVGEEKTASSARG